MCMGTDLALDYYTVLYHTLWVTLDYTGSQ